MTIVQEKPTTPATESCCTCATLLSDVPQSSDYEKPFPHHRRLDCCARVICGRCIYNNYRFQTYCPYCQISHTDYTLPPGLRDPPSYAASAVNASSRLAPPPPYSPSAKGGPPPLTPQDEKLAAARDEPAEDILHFLDHDHDSINSLSLRYGVPAGALRRANNIHSDNLILGRRTVVIPGEHYKGGVSLSPRPVEGEDEEARKAKIRRWMVACKVHDYEIALLYLEQAGYDVQAASDAYYADEKWEQTHPIEAVKKGKKQARPDKTGVRATSSRSK
ncbi:hypothetical protein GGR57DRAFT_446975 [Xylariaceae sp. FL1272]|nr:hypothetical protein GGR57DRAFT_446975 [Xylariaceae sp. FL1272]